MQWDSYILLNVAKCHSGPRLSRGTNDYAGMWPGMVAWKTYLGFSEATLV